MLAFICSACATAPKALSQKLPDYSGITNTAQTDRSGLYQKLSLSQTQGLDGQIGDSWYGISELKKACVPIKADSARHAFSRAYTKRIIEDSLPPATLGLGMFLGAYCGALVYLSEGTSVYAYKNGNYVYDHTDYSGANQAAIWVGLAIGTVVGALGGIWEYYALDRSVSRDMGIAAERYNKKLGQLLQVDILPSSNGAKAGLDLKF